MILSSPVTAAGRPSVVILRPSPGSLSCTSMLYPSTRNSQRQRHHQQQQCFYYHRWVDRTLAVPRESVQLVTEYVQAQQQRADKAAGPKKTFRQVLLEQAQVEQSNNTSLVDDENQEQPLAQPPVNQTAVDLLRMDKEVSLIRYHGFVGYLRHKREESTLLHNLSSSTTVAALSTVLVKFVRQPLSGSYNWFLQSKSHSSLDGVDDRDKVHSTTTVISSSLSTDDDATSAKKAQVAFMLTARMRHELGQLGYEMADIRKMTPQQANEVLRQHDAQHSSHHHPPSSTVPPTISTSPVADPSTATSSDTTSGPGSEQTPQPPDSDSAEGSRLLPVSNQSIPTQQPVDVAAPPPPVTAATTASTEASSLATVDQPAGQDETRVAAGSLNEPPEQKEETTESTTPASTSWLFASKNEMLRRDQDETNESASLEDTDSATVEDMEDDDGAEQFWYELVEESSFRGETSSTAVALYPTAKEAQEGLEFKQASAQHLQQDRHRDKADSNSTATTYTIRKRRR